MLDKRYRYIYIDIASGIMTIWVMVFHALYPMYGTEELKVIPWLYFFMPWFFYKAGMMFRPKEMTLEISNGWRKLIITFLLWSLIGWVAYIGWHWFIGDLSYRIAFYSPIRSLILNAAVPLNGALWFLPILFIVRVISNFFFNKAIRAEWIIIASILIVLICKLLNWQFMPVYIHGTAFGLFFFAWGYLLKGKEIERTISIIALLIYIGSLFTEIPSVYCKSGTIVEQIIWYPTCVAGCITFNNFCRLLGFVVDEMQIRVGLFQYIGQNALNFYAPHKIIFHIGFNLIVFYREDWYSSWQGFCLVMIAYAIFLPIINLIINWIHKQ